MDLTPYPPETAAPPEPGSQTPSLRRHFALHSGRHARNAIATGLVQRATPRSGPPPHSCQTWHAGPQHRPRPPDPTETALPARSGLSQTLGSSDLRGGAASSRAWGARGRGTCVAAQSTPGGFGHRARGLGARLACAHGRRSRRAPASPRPSARGRARSLRPPPMSTWSARGCGPRPWRAQGAGPRVQQRRRIPSACGQRDGGGERGKGRRRRRKRDREIERD